MNIFVEVGSFLLLIFIVDALVTATEALGSFLVAMIDSVIELIQSYRRNDK